MTRDNRVGLSMSFLQKLCATLSISFGSMPNHARNECELKTWATCEL
jgi:hypothetical protein